MVYGEQYVVSSTLEFLYKKKTPLMHLFFLCLLDEILAQFPSTKKDDKSSKSGPSSTGLVQ